ncbi:MAG: hypothetical protein ACTSRI_01960 [Promethearchaeota archaeon]
MKDISNLFSKNERDSIKCQFCGYIIVKPYPSNSLCPNCKKFLATLLQKVQNGDISKGDSQLEPKQFETKTTTVSSKLKRKVKVKKNIQEIIFDGDKIEFKKGKEYIKLLGITSVERTPLYCSNDKYIYLLELTNNLDFIATSILGGELDKMLLISEENKKEKCQFFEKNDLIYIVYGVFPDKKGKWILEQLAKHYSELVRGKDVNKLDKFIKYEINLKFDRMTKSVLKEYLMMQEVFSDQEIPYIDDKIRLDYLGLSSKSIGVLSLLLGDELNIEILGNYENPEEIKEMKESTLTAKIEALAANTQGNTGAFPRWIAVKLGFQKYRFLTFQKYKNDYYLSLLSEGNFEKIEKVEAQLESLVNKVVDQPFSGNLRPFNTLKMELIEKLEKKRVFS